MPWKLDKLARAVGSFKVDPVADVPVAKYIPFDDDMDREEEHVITQLK